MKKKLTICICTFNRPFFLNKLLESLQAEQNVHLADFLIINNGYEFFLNNHFEKLVSVIKESKQGISHARNTALKNCSTEYIIFLDDDGTVNENFVQMALLFIENHKPEAFTGKIVPFFKDKPRWMSQEILGFIDYEENVIMELSENEFITGGLMGFKTSLYPDILNFDTTLGHQGKKINFFEEAKVELNLRKNACKIMLHSGLVLYHDETKYCIFKNNVIKEKLLAQNFWHLFSQNKSYLKLIRVGLYQYTRLFKKQSECNNSIYQFLAYFWLKTLFFVYLHKSWFQYHLKGLSRNI